MSLIVFVDEGGTSWASVRHSPRHCLLRPGQKTWQMLGRTLGAETYKSARMKTMHCNVWQCCNVWSVAPGCNKPSWLRLGKGPKVQMGIWAKDQVGKGPKDQMGKGPKDQVEKYQVLIMVCTMASTLSSMMVTNLERKMLIIQCGSCNYQWCVSLL